MRKTALVLAALLAACFTLADADAAKRKRVAKPAVAPDPIAEWNKKNAPAMQPMQPIFVDPAAKPAAKKAVRAKKKAMRPMKKAAKKK